MIVTYVRSSSYNNYAYCEMQYFITYVLGHQPSSGKKAELGTMAHKVMEVLAGLKKYQQDNTRAKILVVNDDALGEVKFPKKSLMSNETVDKLIGMSIEAYSQKSHHKFYKGDKEDVINTVWTFLKHSDGMFDPRLRNIHHPEPHFDIPIEEDWAKFDINDRTKFDASISSGLAIMANQKHLYLPEKKDSKIIINFARYSNE